MPMPLNQLLPQAQSSTLIRELTLDSRKVRPGDLFLAVPGRNQDGRAHIADAIARGAAAIAYEAGSEPLAPVSGVELVALAGLAAQLSAIAGRFYGEPSRALRTVGVTGTNGKTSVSQLLAQALDRLGEHCGLIGTLGNGFFGRLEQGQHTTPDPIGVQATLANLKNDGAQAVAMEVSSHGLDQGRVAALDFDVAVFTNLTRDHLDYHGDMAAYGAAKARLFEQAGLRSRVINLDDEFGRELALHNSAARLISYSIDDASAWLHCTEVRFDEQGVQARVVTPSGEGMLRSPLLGRFNLSNLLAVVGALLALDYPLDDALKVIPQLQAPAGRMQRLGGVNQPLVVIDYAHTPDALAQVLQALRPHTEARLLCLFGCGGDRDNGKRPLMGQIAESYADLLVVTDDNPRSEAAAQIREQILTGLSKPEAALCVADRAEAINTLIAQAGRDDVVLLAGKGHEDYQEINGQRLPFSDLQVAERALQAWEASHA